jgi:lysyl endopeptidase
MDHPANNCRIRDEIPVDNVTTVRLPEIDVQALQEQDQNLPKDAPLRYAIPAEVNIKPSAQDQWAKTDDDMQVWRLKIISPQALSLSLGFTVFNMPEGGCLFLYSPDHNQVLGPYTKDDNAEHGQLSTPTIDGQEVFIEVSISNEQFSRMQLVLGFVNQGYKK